MMTERIHPLSPPFATTTLPASNAILPAVKRDVSQNVVTDGEENDEADYTIKCICDFDDDDGNTVYCEPCDTWQHILCFYPNDPHAPNREDFLHKCHTCQPRPLDREGANRRQKSSRATEPTVRAPESRHGSRDERPRPKKQPSKSHKKKRNLSEINLNGFDHKKSISHENAPHTKKPKAHRTNASISSQVPKRSPSHPTNGHPPSPATTPPDFPDNIRLYGHSSNLKDIYERDAIRLESNEFASDRVKHVLNDWATDKDKIRKDTGHEDVDDILLPLVGGGIATYPFPQLQLQTENVWTDDAPLPVKYLTVRENTAKERLMGELNGLVGLGADFANSEFYKRVSHPPPFVFFHDHLPLYIDTRTEGSICRYARRSCRPTCSIDTYLGKGNKYHFMLVNDRQLSPGERLTLPWHFVFGKAIEKRYESLLVPNQLDTNLVPAADATPEEFDILSELITNLLTEYGGCACGLGNDCSFVKFHRNYLEHTGKLQNQPNGLLKQKKSRKPKNQTVATSTGNPINSRDASEGGQDQFDDDDARSTSGSVRSKPQSRDMTPLGPETNGEAHISEREKRKIEAAEKLFEQDQPPRKKKRPSDGLQINGATPAPTDKKKHRSAARPSASTQAQTNGTKQYKDASTSRQPSASPSLKPSPTTGVSPRSRLPSQAPSVPSHSRQASVAPNNYTDNSMQTDPAMDTDSWYSPCKRRTSKKRIVSFAARMLNARMKTNATREARKAEEMQQRTLMEAQSLPSEGRGSMSPTVARRASIVSIHDVIPNSEVVAEGDVMMHDAPLLTSKPEPPTWPDASQATGPTASLTSNRIAPEMKVIMPPAPSFSNMTTGVPLAANGTATPSSATASLAQSPFSSIHLPSAFSPQILNSVGQAPSPIKKKLSLSDYKARLKKPATTTPLENDSIPEEHKAEILEGSAIVDTPASDAKSLDPLAFAGEKLATTNIGTDAVSADEAKGAID